MIWQKQLPSGKAEFEPVSAALKANAFPQRHEALRNHESVLIPHSYDAREVIGIKLLPSTVAKYSSSIKISVKRFPGNAKEEDFAFLLFVLCHYCSFYTT